MEKVFTDANFEEEVLKSSVPVFVDFWAAWCGPCHMMSPIVETLAEKYAGQNIKVGKCNSDENNDIAVKYNIMSIPSFVMFKNGEVVDQIIGAVPKERLQAMMEKHMV